MCIALTDRPLCRGDDVFRCAAQFLRNAAQQKKIAPRHPLPPTPATNPDAPLLRNLTRAPHQNVSNLRRPIDMRPAARLQVRAFNLDNAQDSTTLNFLPHSQFFKLLRGAIAHHHRSVFSNHLVRRSLCAFENVLGRLRPANINRAHLTAQMKRYRRPTVPLLKHRGKQMLAGVLLHMIEPPRPIDATLNVPKLQLAINNVNDVFSSIAHIETIPIPQLAQVVRRASRSRIERRGIEHYRQSRRAAVRLRLATQHSRLKIALERIVIIKSPRSHRVLYNSPTCKP